MTMKELEEKVIKERYGREAKPILIADKSIEGLIAANCPRKSMVLAREIIKSLIP